MVVPLLLALTQPQDTAQIVPAFSSAHYDLTPTFSPDFTAAYYTVSTPSYGRRHTILKRTAERSTWGEPVVADFSGVWSDADPFLDHRRSRILFISNRPESGDVPRRDFDIFMARDNGKGWSEPVRLPEPVNSPGGELYVTATDSGTLYITSNREGGKGSGDTYRCIPEGDAYNVENVEALNSPAHDTTPVIAPDESFVIFASGREGGQGDLDLYVSFRQGAGWTAPKNLGPGINTRSREYCPLISPDGKTLYFSSDRSVADQLGREKISFSDLNRFLSGPGNTLGDVYRAPMTAVLALR